MEQGKDKEARRMGNGAKEGPRDKTERNNERGGRNKRCLELNNIAHKRKIM